MNEEKLGEAFGRTFYFNESYTEMFFDEAANAQYFRAKGKKIHQVANNAMTGIYLPDGVIRKEQYMETFDVVTYGIKTFEDTVLNIVGSPFYLGDKNEEAVRVIDGVRSVKMTQDGNSLVCLDSAGDVWYVKNVEKPQTAKVLAKGLEVQKLFTSENGKKIYFVTDNVLYYLKRGKGVRIADVNTCVYSEENNGVYFIEDKELFFATTSAKKKQNVVGKEVNKVFGCGENIFFQYDQPEDDEFYRLYILTGKTEYELFDVQK